MIVTRELFAEDFIELGIELPETLYRSKKANEELQNVMNEAGIPGRLLIPLTLLKRHETQSVRFEEKISIKSIKMSNEEK